MSEHGMAEITIRQQEVLTVPLPLDDRFIPPDIGKALDFYGEYKQRGGAWTFQGYLSWILGQIDRAKPNGYRSGDEAFKEYVEWLGGLDEFLRKYQHERAA